MKTPVASTRTLLVVVLILALDLYLILYGVVDRPYLLYKGWPLWIHAGFGYESWPLWFRVGFAGSLPMANAVVAGGSMLFPWGKGSRPFLTGFVLSGAPAPFALLGLSLVFPREWFASIYLTAFEALWKLYLSHRSRIDPFYREYHFAAEMVLYTVLFTIPELLIAVTGGLLARRSSRVGPGSGRLSGACVSPSDSP